MKFKFKIQQYQTEAVENTVAVFTGQPSHAIEGYRLDRGLQAQRQLEFDDETGYRNHCVELDGKALLKTSIPFRTCMTSRRLLPFQRVLAR